MRMNICNLLLLFFVFVSMSFAENPKPIHGYYCYHFGDSESKVDARKKAKLLAIKEAIINHKLIISSESKVVNYELTEDIVRAISRNNYVTNIKETRTDKGNYEVCSTINALVYPEKLQKFIAQKKSKQEIKPNHNKLIRVFPNRLFNYDSDIKCFNYGNICYSNINTLVKKLIEDEILKVLPNYIKDQDINYLIEIEENVPILIDLDEVMKDPSLNTSLKKKLGQLAFVAKSYDIQTNFDTLIYQKALWGFERGKYKIKNENEKMEAGIIAFFKYLAEKLIPKIKSKKFRMEIMTVGYTDAVDVSDKGIDYHLSNNGAFVIKHNSICSTAYAQPIYCNQSNHVWKKIGTESYSQRKIGKKIYDNCELSFARGYEAIQFLKKFSHYLEKNNNIYFDYAYSGKGVDMKDIDSKKKRKIKIVLQKSRFQKN